MNKPVGCQVASKLNNPAKKLLLVVHWIHQPLLPVKPWKANPSEMLFTSKDEHVWACTIMYLGRPECFQTAKGSETESLNMAFQGQKISIVSRALLHALHIDKASCNCSPCQAFTLTQQENIVAKLQDFQQSLPSRRVKKNLHEIAGLIRWSWEQIEENLVYYVYTIMSQGFLSDFPRGRSGIVCLRIYVYVFCFRVCRGTVGLQCRSPGVRCEASERAIREKLLRGLQREHPNTNTYEHILYVSCVSWWMVSPKLLGWPTRMARCASAQCQLWCTTFEKARSLHS